MSSAQPLLLMGVCLPNRTKTKNTYGMAVSEAELKETYRRLPDEKLLRIASEGAATLRPEALLLLKAELSARGLGEVAERAIAARLRVASAAEVAEYCALLRALPCPICHSTARPLNAAITSQVMSFVVMTTSKKRFVIACPTCLDKLHRDATTTSALVGWWGLPWGPIRTVQALLANDKMAKANHAPQPNDLLKTFVVQHVGRIEAARDNPADLAALISTRHLS